MQVATLLASKVSLATVALLATTAASVSEIVCGGSISSSYSATYYV